MQSSKPVLMTDAEFFACCCWSCGSTITVQVCCDSGVYSVFHGSHTLTVVTSYGTPYYYSKFIASTNPLNQSYIYLLQDGSSWVLVLQRRIINGVVQLISPGSIPYNYAYIKLRASSGYTGTCPPSSTYNRIACGEANYPTGAASVCSCSINADIVAYVGMSTQTCSCSTPTLAISSSAIPDADQGTAYNFTFTISNPKLLTPYFSIDWGDGTSATATATGCDHYVVISKTFNYPGEFTVTATAKTSSTGSVIDTETASVEVARVFDFDECDAWFNANSGGYGGTSDTWTMPDVATVPVGTPIDLRFEAYSVPDRFRVTYNGVEVYNSLWRGSASTVSNNPSTYDGTYPDNYGGTGSGTALSVFTRVSGVNTLTVDVDGPGTGTAWNYDIRANCSGV